MRQGQQNRRGRGRGRKPQNPLARNYESNGPDVKIRGTAAHIAWYGSSGSTLLLVTTCTTQALTTGNTVNVPAHDFEIRDVA